MALTDVALRAVKPDGRRRRLYDTEGLYLELTAGGSRVWRLKYRFDRKERSLTLGKYPEMSLKIARLKRNEAREQVRSGIDPNASRRKALSACI